MRTSLTVEEALEVVLEHTNPLTDTETVSLGDAAGRVLAADLESRVDHPDVDNTAIDGYAARAADTAGASRENPVRLRLVGASPAGRPFTGSVGPGEAVSIFTGAPLPAGADAVVAVEDTERDGDKVILYAPATPKDIRKKAQDLERGRVYLKKGELLTPGRVGLAAAMGYAELPVVRKPRVGILSTGDEVVEPGQPLPPGGVYNSNAYSVAAQVRQAGGEPVLLGKVDDRLEALRERLAAAGNLDLILSSGGVSMGDYDIVRHLLEREGEIVFWKILQRPGGPPIFAEYRGTPFFGLPGNPVSAMVIFFLYGRAMLFKMLGRRDPPYRRVRALAEDGFKGAGKKVAFRRAVLSYDPEAPGCHRVKTVGNQSSEVLRSMAFGNALVVVPPHSRVEPGQVVEVIPFVEP
ncbi:molybdopterin molybdotransferase MoeA [Oceanithermus sp.]